MPATETIPHFDKMHPGVAYLALGDYQQYASCIVSRLPLYQFSNKGSFYRQALEFMDGYNAKLILEHYEETEDKWEALHGLSHRFE